MNKNATTAGRLVFLLDHATKLERRLLTDWIDSGGAGNATGDDVPTTLSLPFRSGRSGATTLRRLEELCSTTAEFFFIPLRVLWLPPAQHSNTRLRIRELLAGDPRSPGRMRQRLIRLRDPSRARPVAAPGASLDELRRRLLRRDPAAAADPHRVAEFICRQAVLALERTEAHARGARYKVPRLVNEEILARPSFENSLVAEAKNLGRPLDDVRKEALGCLREMAAEHSPLALDVLAELGRYLYTRGFDREIEMIPQEIERIRELVRTRPVAFLMTHKSHLDGFLLVTLFSDLDLPPLHTFGGINMSFFGLGALGRRSGAIFIRRSFNDDPVYKLVFRHYIDYLAEKHFPLLWALEGTRSRTGKLMPPRYGLIGYVAESYARAAITDLVLMPISIVYDQVPEVADYAAEARGAVKRPESASWFMKYISGLNNPFGRIHVRFGKGVALADVLGDRRDHGEVTKLDVQKLAFRLAVDTNNVTPVPASALVTFVLLAHGHRALTIGELIGELAALRRYLQAKEIPLTVDVDLATREVLHRVMGQLQHTGIVRVFEDGLEPVYAIPPSAGFAAAYYRNTFVHFLVNGSIAELALLQVAESSVADRREALHQEALRLRDLLKFEFFFEEKEEFLAALERELDLRRPQWRHDLDDGDDAIVRMLGSLDPLLAHGTLRPFIESYAVVADALLLEPAGQEVNSKAFIRRCVALGQQRVLQRRVTSDESVAKAYFEAGLKLAGNRGLLAPDAADARSAREQFATEIGMLVRRIDRIAALAQNRWSGTQGRS